MRKVILPTAFLVFFMITASAGASWGPLQKVFRPSINQELSLAATEKGEARLAWLEEAKIEADIEVLRLRFAEQKGTRWSNKIIASFADEQILPPEEAVSLASRGGVDAIAWTSNPSYREDPRGEDGEWDDIPGIRSSWGVSLSIRKNGEFQTVPLSAAYSGPPKVAINAQGEAIVAWFQEREESSGEGASEIVVGLEAAKVDSSGRMLNRWTLGQTSVLKEYGFYSQIQMAGDKNDNLTGLWPGVTSLLLSSDIFPVTELGPPDIYNMASLDVSSSGNVAASWIEEEQVKGVFWNVQTEEAEGPFVISALPGISSADVATNNQGDMALGLSLYDYENDRYGVRFLKKNTGSGIWGQLASSTLKDEVNNVAVAFDSYNKANVVWGEGVEDNEKVTWMRENSSGGVNKPTLVGEGAFPEMVTSRCKTSLVWKKTTDSGFLTGWLQDIRARDYRTCPALGLAIKGPRAVTKGGRALYRVRLLNRGGERAASVQLRVRLGSVVRKIQMAGLDQSKQLVVALPARSQGKKRVLFTASASNAKTISTKRFLRVR